MINSFLCQTLINVNTSFKLLITYTLFEKLSVRCSLLETICYTTKNEKNIYTSSRVFFAVIYLLYSSMYVSFLFLLYYVPLSNSGYVDFNIIINLCLISSTLSWLYFAGDYKI